VSPQAKPEDPITLGPLLERIAEWLLNNSDCIASQDADTLEVETAQKNIMADEQFLPIASVVTGRTYAVRTVNRKGQRIVFRLSVDLDE